MIHRQFHAAQRQIELGNDQTAYDLFLPIAALSDPEIGTAYAGDHVGEIGDTTITVTQSYTEGRCHNYRDIARVYVDPNAAKKNLRTRRGYTDAELFDGYWTDAARGKANPFGAPLELELAPNPTDDLFFLSTYRDGVGTYVCYDGYGREVARGDFERSIKVMTHDWTPGVYTVEVRYPNRRPHSERIVVTR